MSTEAMKLALEALRNSWTEPCNEQYEFEKEAITALQKALANEAIERMAQNARELGLDYDTSAGTQVSKVWWDGEKLMAKPIPFVEFYKPVQQEPVAWLQEIARLHDLINDLTLDVEFLSQPAKQEPVAWMQDSIELYVQDIPSATYTIPLYTSPPAQLKPLTDEQLADFLGDEYHAMTAEEERYFRLAEAAHGIKENR